MIGSFSTTGDLRCDAQHFVIFRILEYLKTVAEEESATPEKIRKVVYFLDRYSAHHFSREERLSSLCAVNLANKAAHEEFKKWLRDLKEQVSVDRDSYELCVTIVVYLISWVDNHIKTIDREISPYLNAIRHEQDLEGIGVDIFYDVGSEKSVQSIS